MKYSFFVLAVCLISSCQPQLSRSELAMRGLETEANRMRNSQSAANLDRYVGSIIHAYDAKVDEKGDPVQRQKLSQSKEAALSLLDQQINASPSESHYFLARKGELHLYAGEAEQGVGALKKSYKQKPNIKAATWLVHFHGKRNDQIALSSMCQEAVMTTENGSDQYKFISECRSATGAATEDGKMAWANPQIREFYQTETTRRHKIEKERQRQAAIAAVAEFERQEKVRKHQEKVAANKEICEAGCEEKGAYCKRGCGDNVNCQNRCIEAQNACYQKCYKVAQRDL